MTDKAFESFRKFWMHKTYGWDLVWRHGLRETFATRYKNMNNCFKFDGICMLSEETKKNDAITEKNMRSIRPGLGLSPKYYDVVLGKEVSCDVKRGTAMRWDILA